MRDASFKGARRALDAGDLLKRSELRERGWTDSMIRRLLTEPDATLPNPEYRSGAPMRLYLRERVEVLETSTDFLRLRDIGAQRAERARKAATRRAASLVETARCYVPTLPAALDYVRLLKHAIRAYNDENMHRERFADPSSDPAFLARISWNYFRHHLTDWDATWDALSGKPGVRDAYLVAAGALTAHVCERFPLLREAATAWLVRKQSSVERVLAAALSGSRKPASTSEVE